MKRLSFICGQGKAMYTNFFLQAQNFLMEQQINNAAFQEEMDAMVKKPLLLLLFIVENACKAARTVLQEK